MGRLIYVTNVSLDGYCEDGDGRFDFGPMDDALFRCYVELMASTRTLLYGRRLYEAMALWETDPSLAQQSSLTAEFAEAWQAASKVVFSTSLSQPSTARTRVERAFSPELVREMVTSTDGELTVGGAHLAAQALDAGVVDECHLFIWPVVVGRGKPALPVGRRLELELRDERRFANGVVLLRYRVIR